MPISDDKPSNRLINAEDMTEGKLRALAVHYDTLSASLENEDSHKGSHSIEHVIDDAYNDVN